MASVLFIEAKEEKKGNNRLEVSGTYKDNSFRILLNSSGLDLIMDSFVRALQRNVLSKPGGVAEVASALHQFQSHSEDGIVYKS